MAHALAATMRHARRKGSLFPRMAMLVPLGGPAHAAWYASSLSRRLQYAVIQAHCWALLKVLAALCCSVQFHRTGIMLQSA